MKVRHGRYGAFLGCLRYPDCKGIVNIPKKGERSSLQKKLPACPAIGCPGKMVARKSRFGKTFYSCSTFPECDVIVNQLDQLASKYPTIPARPYVKKPKKGALQKLPPKQKPKQLKLPLNPRKKRQPKRKLSQKMRQLSQRLKTRTMPPVHLSAELADIVGGKSMPRGMF